MNLHVMNTYRLDVISMLGAAINENDAQKAHDGFAMYKDCMMMAIENGFLAIARDLSDKVYGKIDFAKLIADRTKGTVSSELFSTIIDHMPPKMGDMYNRDSTDEITSQMLSRFLESTVLEPSPLIHYLKCMGGFNFPSAFCIALQAVLEHPDQEGVIGQSSDRSVINALYQFIKPDQVKTEEGGWELRPKDLTRSLPDRAIELIAIHHETMAKIHLKLGAHEAHDSLPMVELVRMGTSVPKVSVERMTLHHSLKDPDPRYDLKMRNLGVDTDLAHAVTHFELHARQEDTARFEAVKQYWGRWLSLMIEDPALPVDRFEALISTTHTKHGRFRVYMDCVEATLAHLATGTDPALETVAKIEVVCNHILEHNGHWNWLKSALLSLPNLPRNIAHHPLLITECLEIDLGL